MRAFIVGAVACLVAFAAILAGCGKPAIVGEWETTQSENIRGVQASAQVHASFKPDGKFTVTNNIQAMGQSMTLQREGTWEVKGENITLASDTQLLNGVPQRGNVQTKTTEKFRVNGDTLTITSGNAKPVTLKRVK